MTVLGLSHIDVPVSNLERTERLMTQTLGFLVKRRGDGWVDVDTGTCLLRLFNTRQVEQRVTLRIQATDVAADTQCLKLAGLKVLYEPLRTPDQELFSQLVDATRVVSRENVIRSFILSSAKVTRFRVRQPLIDHGVNLDNYTEEFAAEERM